MADHADTERWRYIHPPDSDDNQRDRQVLRAFIRDKLGFPFTDVGGGWLIFDLPEADMGLMEQVRARES